MNALADSTIATFAPVAAAASSATPHSPLAAFVALVDNALAGHRFDRLVLSKPRAPGSDLIRVTVRSVALKGVARLAFVYSYRNRDITQHHGLDEAAGVLAAPLADGFAQAQLFAGGEEAQLLTSRKGRRTLLRRAAPVAAPGADSQAMASTAPDPLPAHDRAKRRIVDPRAPFLTALGVTDAEHRLVPAMARKWKQINKFVEVLDHALAGTALASQASGIDVVDFGSGKGYLTFALHEHLQRRLKLAARVTGVELRADMVTLCNAAATRLRLDGLRFEHGDVRSTRPDRIDIMIALHACDTATDHAIATGVQAGAAIIMCSPCCHQELRPQLLSPHPLRPILKHGVHLGQQAEMLTDTLRAMALEACGYETQVFEFVALEHSQKNKMILAVRRERAASASAVEGAWREIDALKDFYGIRSQCLEHLLRSDEPKTAIV